MAAKDANHTRRGTQKVTDLSQRRLDAVRAGEKPLCGSPLRGSKNPDNPTYGKTCKQVAGTGTDHYGSGTCSRHGGNMKPAKVTAARERVATTVQQYKDDLTFYGARASISFEEALLEELQRSVGIVRWMEEKIGQWGAPKKDGDDWKWVSDDTGLPPLQEMYAGFRAITIADSEYQAWLRQYSWERRHLAQVAKDGIQAGIAKNMVVVYQQQADLMNRVLRESLRRLGVQDGDDRIHEILPAVIREITSGMKQSA